MKKNDKTLSLLNQPLALSALPEEIHDVFRQTMQEDINKFIQAINKKDRRLGKQLAHRMKGAFKMLSLSEASQYCEDLEQLLQKETEHIDFYDKILALHTYLSKFFHD